MKKIFTGLCGLLVLTAIAAFVAIKPKIDFQHKLDSRQDDANDPLGLKIPGYEIKDIDQLMQYVTTVVIAKIDKIEHDSYDNIGFEITLFPKEVLWGDCPYDELILFDDIFGGRHIEEGKEYLFFLRALDIYAYPANSYNIIEWKSVFTFDYGRLYGTVKATDSWLSEENNTLSKMRDYLSKFPEPSVNANTVADSYDSVSDMYEASDSVSKVKITSSYRENAIVDAIGIEISEKYKGEALSEEITYFWPSDKHLIVGEEYYVFTDADGLLIAREGAIIGKRDDTYQEAKEFFADR